MSGSESSTPAGSGPAHPPPSLGDDEPEDMFIDEVHEYLKCAICLCVLKNPYQVSRPAMHNLLTLINALLAADPMWASLL